MKEKILTFGFCSSASIKADHAAKKKLREKTRNRDRANKRNKKSWLVMFEASNISDSSVASKETSESIALNIKLCLGP